MTIYIAAWHYWARVVVQRTWGWSPIEELVLLHLDGTPGSIEAIGTDLNLSTQIVSATIARFMDFGLIELRTSPRPIFSTSAIGREFVRSGRPLPERTSDREVPVSLVYERVGQSIFKRREVKLVSAADLEPVNAVVRFSRDEPDETDETMALRVGRFMAGTLRPGEWLRGVRAVSSVLSRRYLSINLDDARKNIFPDGSSDELIRALRATLATGVPPVPAPVKPDVPPPIEVEFEDRGFILGASDHVDRFEAIVDSAASEIFVLSTFVAPQADEKGREQRNRIFNALGRAIKRGVRCHLFFGTSLDEQAKHALAMEEIRARLSASGFTRGYLLVHRDSARSHTKFLAADDGKGGGVVLIGSCNWFSSPFSAVEASVELRDGNAAALGFDLLRAILVLLPEASRSVEVLCFMAAELRRTSRDVAYRCDPSISTAKVRLSVVYAADHEQVLRKAAHEAKVRFVCCTNRVGANMVPALFTPAEVAGRRLNDVRVLYSRQTGPTKRRHVTEHRERLEGVVDLIGVREPQLHCKFLLWDDDHVVVSTMNWGSQSGRRDHPLDEIGIQLNGPGLAVKLLKRIERIISDPAKSQPIHAEIGTA